MWAFWGSNNNKTPITRPMKTVADRFVILITEALLTLFIWLLISSLQSTEEGEEAGVWGWVGQKFLDLKGK